MFSLVTLKHGVTFATHFISLKSCLVSPKCVVLIFDILARLQLRAVIATWGASGKDGVRSWVPEWQEHNNISFASSKICHLNCSMFKTNGIFLLLMSVVLCKPPTQVVFGARLSFIKSQCKISLINASLGSKACGARGQEKNFFWTTPGKELFIHPRVLAVLKNLYSLLSEGYPQNCLI